MGWKASPNEMLRMAEELYAAGATAVYVTNIEQFQGREIAAILVVQLPANEVGRQQVFAWRAEFAKSIEAKPARDVGQKYLKIVLD